MSDLRKRRATIFARLQGGHLQSGEIVDRDKVIGTWTWQAIRRKGVLTTTNTYALLDGRMFDNTNDFLTAYAKSKGTTNG